MGKAARMKKERLTQSLSAQVMAPATGACEAPKNFVIPSAERHGPMLPGDQAPEIPMILKADGTPYNCQQDRTLYQEPIALGYVHTGMVHEVWSRCVTQMVRADANIKIMLHESSCNLPLNRNSVIRKFMDAPEEQGKWLLFVDTDLSFPPFTAALMLKVAKETKADMVAVPYQLTNGCSTFARAIPGGGYHTQGNFTFDRAYEIDAAGTGMMLISRDILAKMRVAYADKEPWPWCGYDHITIHGKPEYESEDYSLCRRMTEVGGKIVGYTGIVLGHQKVHPLVFRGLEAELVR